MQKAMGKSHSEQDHRASALQQLQHPRQPSTSSTTFPITDSQHVKDNDSLMNQIPTLNKRSKSFDSDLFHLHQLNMTFLIIIIRCLFIWRY